MNKIIRVFARKTSFTPTDCWSFYDGPPLFPLPNWPVYVSVTFSWDIKRGEQLARDWQGKAFGVHIGGPAFGTKPMQFTPGRFLKPGITITSRGCPKNCPWCFVPRYEGRLRPIAIKPGYIIQDNNILACSMSHFQRVCDMLAKQTEPAQFKGGLDIDYLFAWHVDCLLEIKVAELWIACDNKAGLARLDKAKDLLSDFPLNKKRCYVLIGHGDETLSEAEARCIEVYEKGFLPFAQLFRDVKPIDRSPEWKKLARKWSRPAIYKSFMEQYE